MHFYHALLLVYSWMSGSVTNNMYQFEEHTMWIGTIEAGKQQTARKIHCNSHDTCSAMARTQTYMPGTRDHCCRPPFT